MTGILRMAYYNLYVLHNWVAFHPLYTTNHQGPFSSPTTAGSFWVKRSKNQSVDGDHHQRYRKTQTFCKRNSVNIGVGFFLETFFGWITIKIVFFSNESCVNMGMSTKIFRTDPPPPTTCRACRAVVNSTAGSWWFPRWWNGNEAVHFLRLPSILGGGVP